MKLNNLNPKFLICLILIISFPVYARLENIFDGKTTIEKPFNLRDPFQEPLIKTKEKPQSGVGKNNKGVYSNIRSIGQVQLKDISIVGVLIGKERRAIVKVGAQKDPFILKEGMNLGENNAEIKAIVPGGMILVEKVVNIYGEDEYLETVIPISK